MRTIEFSVNQQRIKNKNSICHLYSGTNNYLRLKFDFDESWDGCAIGISLGSKGIPKILDEENSCVVPGEAFDETQLSFYLLGVKTDYKVKSEEFVIKLS